MDRTKHIFFYSFIKNECSLKKFPVDNQYYVVHEGIIEMMSEVSLDGLPRSICLHFTGWFSRMKDSIAHSSKRLSMDSIEYKRKTKDLNELYQLLQVAVANLRHNYKAIENISNYSSIEKEKNPFYAPAKIELKTRLLSQCNREAVSFDSNYVLKSKMLSEKLDDKKLLDELWADVNRTHFGKTWKDVRKREKKIKKAEEEAQTIWKQYQSFQIENNKLKEEIKNLRTDNQELRNQVNQLIQEGKKQSDSSSIRYKINFKELEANYEQLLNVIKDTAAKKEDALIQQVRLIELKASRMKEEFDVLFNQKFDGEIEKRARELASKYLKQEFPFQ